MKYIKQELFPPMQGSQSLLKDKVVAVIGVGGLGSHSAEMLVRMGVGTVILIDDDIVEPSNLPRQGMYTEMDSLDREFKAEAAKRQLSSINSETNIQTYIDRLQSHNIHDYLQNVDVVLDGMDNLVSRYLLNDYCYLHGIPWIYASATGSVGSVVNFVPEVTPCFRCVFGSDLAEGTLSCDSNGIILPILTMTVSYQVTEAIKMLLNQEFSKEEIRFDIWNRVSQSVPTTIFADESCFCQNNSENPSMTDYNNQFYMLCSGDSIQVHTEMPKDKVIQLLQQNEFEVREIGKEVYRASRGDNERVLIMQTGRLIFHQMSKEDIEGILREDK